MERGELNKSTGGMIEDIYKENRRDWWLVTDQSDVKQKSIQEVREMPTMQARL
jgi:hypothetical protein